MTSKREKNGDAPAHYQNPIGSNIIDFCFFFQHIRGSLTLARINRITSAGSAEHRASHATNYPAGNQSTQDEHVVGHVGGEVVNDD